MSVQERLARLAASLEAQKTKEEAKKVPPPADEDSDSEESGEDPEPGHRLSLPPNRFEPKERVEDDPDSSGSGSEVDSSEDEGDDSSHTSDEDFIATTTTPASVGRFDFAGSVTLKETLLEAVDSTKRRLRVAKSSELKLVIYEGFLKEVLLHLEEEEEADSDDTRDTKAKAKAKAKAKPRPTRKRRRRHS